MNMWVSASLTTSPSAAHAIRQRLMGKPKPVQMAPRLDVVVTALPAPSTGGRPKKIIRRPRGAYDEHMRDYFIHVLSSKETLLVSDFIRLRCLEMRIPVKEMLSDSRKSYLIMPRHHLMWEVRQKYPHFSMPHIGRIFGRDHSVIIYAIRKIEDEMAGAGRNKPSIETAPPPAQLDIVRLRAQGMSSQEIQAALGITKNQRKGRQQRAMKTTGSETMEILIDLAKRKGWIE